MVVGSLIVAGFLLLLAEIFLPGLIAGTIGLGCLAAAVFLGYSTYGTTSGNWIGLGVLFGLGTGAIAWLKYFPRSRWIQPMISASRVGNLGLDYSRLIGQTGETRSDLYPSGTAVIDGHRYDVTSQTGFISRDTPIRVVAVEGSRILVEILDPAANAHPTQSARAATHN